MGPGARGIKNRTKLPDIKVHQTGRQSADVATELLNVEVAQACDYNKIICAKYIDFYVVSEILCTR